MLFTDSRAILGAGVLGSLVLGVQRVQMTPPPLALGQRLRITVGFYANGQLGEMTEDYQVTSYTTPPPIQLVGDDFLTAVQANCPAVMPTAVTISGVIVEAYDSSNVKVSQSFVAPDNVTVGTLATNLLPTQVAAVFTKVTGYAGRSMRGRLYWPFLGASQVTAVGELTGAAATAISTAVNDTFTSPALAGGGNVVSLTSMLFHRKTPLAMTEINFHNVTGKLGTQRRRGDYGRANNRL